jgi:pimeloyl-ACP methyl ester carboxylesterase
MTNMPEIRSQDIGGAVLQYLDYPGDGPTVVMLHATGFQPWLWHPIARELAGEFHVIAPYFCDHRVADPEEGGLGWRVLAADLAAFIKSSGIEEPMFVGHSMGATVATIAEVLDGPMAARIVLIEPIFLPSALYEQEITVDQHPLASKAVRRRSEWSDASEAREYLHARRLFAGWDDEVLELYLEHGMTQADNGALTLVCQPRREAALFMGSLEKDPWPLLEKITCPVLLVAGADSENSAVIDLAFAASLIPEAELRVIQDAGHLVPMEKPYELLALIREFFERD